MTEQGMNPLLKDWIQVVSWAVAIVGGLIAAFVAIYQLRANRRQREIELRWNQAKIGRELFDKMLDTSREALLMLDYYEDNNRIFPAIPGEDKTVGLKDILTALDLENVSRAEKSIYIRDHLEKLFYNFEINETYIENKLVTFGDVICPSEYYVEIMAKQKKAYASYLKQAGYKRVPHFLDRFKTWKDA
jgi:hypothetical protein